MAKSKTLVGVTLLLLALWAPAAADQASAHYHAALAHKRAGRTQAAIKELRTAIQQREDYAAAHYSLGILLRQSGDQSKAIYHLERAANLEPKSGEIHYSLGLAFYKAGRQEDAFKTLKRAADLSPKDVKILAQVGVMMIRRDPQAAIGILSRAVKLEPGKANYLHQLGLAYRRATQKLTGPANEGKREAYLKKALGYLKRAGQLKQSAAIEFDIAVCYRHLEKVDEAIEHYEGAVNLDPKLAAAYWDLAHMYKRARRNDEAVGAFEHYLKLKGNAPDAKIARKRIKELKQNK